MKKRVGSYKGKVIVEGGGVGETSLLKHEILFNPNQSLEPINDDDTIVEIYKGSEYVWRLPSPQGEPDSDKWNKYINALNELKLSVFECFYELTYTGNIFIYRGSNAAKMVLTEINQSLPNSYIYNYIRFIREGQFEHPLNKVIYNSLVDFLMKTDSMSEEEALLYMTETLGLERVSLDDYKNIIKDIKDT